MESVEVPRIVCYNKYKISQYKWTSHHMDEQSIGYSLGAKRNVFPSDEKLGFVVFCALEQSKIIKFFKRIVVVATQVCVEPTWK